MIRSSKHILKYQNNHKTVKLEQLFKDYKTDLEYYIKLITSGQLPLAKYLSTAKLPINVIKRSHWRGIAYKNASEIVRGNLDKVKKQCYRKYRKLYAICKEQNKHQTFLSKHYKELKINYLKRIKIDVKNVSMNLDNIIFDIELGQSFNEFIRIRLLGMEKCKKNLFIKIPIKYHKHSNQLLIRGFKRKEGTVQLSQHNGNFYVTFIYEKPNQPKRTTGEQIGFDIGYKKLLSDSNGNHYGKELHEVYENLAKKKRGSKNYKNLLTYKNNLINQVCNNLPLNNVKDVFVENLKYVKHGSKLSTKLMNKMQYWSYRKVLTKLELLSETEGFNLTKVNPAYTSQTCSACGTVDKSSRHGEVYQCKSCGIELDADMNGARNILHRGVYSPSNQENNLL